MENSYNAQDLADRHTSISKLLIKENISERNYICQPKYDGITVELIYEHGNFVKAITRGDGYIGEDITANVRTMQSVPMTLPLGSDCLLLRVRGEIVMSKQALDRVNLQKEAEGEAPFANARNAASGSMRQLDVSITAKRGLQCFIYEILECQLRSGEHITTTELDLDTTTKSQPYEQAAPTHFLASYTASMQRLARQ